MTRHHHLHGPGPKHILALDGGGIRGILTLAFLEKAEELLAHHYGGDPDFRLSDHFALVGGTSTGSIIASGLALGLRARDLIDMYQSLSRETFGKSRWLGGLIAAKFPSGPLIAAITSQVGDIRLGSDQLRCGLGIVAKRIDTHSVWLFHNHPDGPFFGPETDQDITFTANRNLPLINLIRASTAAPTYFEPEFIHIASGVEGVFVDGAVSPHNNPSLAMFMLATINGCGFRWSTGIENLHILSVGTGTAVPNMEGRITARTSATMLALLSLKSMMVDCDNLVQLMMQWMGKANNPVVIDSEFGDLSLDSLGADPLFGYTRYDIKIEREWLSQHLGRHFGDKLLRDLSRIDEPRVVEDLLAIGRESAAKQVKLEQLLASAKA